MLALLFAFAWFLGLDLIYSLLVRLTEREPDRDS